MENKKMKNRESRAVRTRGQSMVVIALCMVVLLAFVGLAVDGGSLYLQRRTAQNASDGAALAGTRTMLNHYDDIMFDTKGYVVDGDRYVEDDILESIHQYATLNGVMTNTLTAYFVNEAKQIISVPSGGSDSCGTGPGMSPCPVGLNDSVPWTQGVKGITVKTRATSDAFFLGLIGFQDVSALASATAFMGVVVESAEPLLPMGFFTNTHMITSFVEGQTYTLMSGKQADEDPEPPAGNWGWLNYNGLNGSASDMQPWLKCSYNPGLRTPEEWFRWCPIDQDNNPIKTGPTMYWLGWPEPSEPDLDQNGVPDNVGYKDYKMQWGPGIQGWWIPGNSGSVRSNCQDLKEYVQDVQTRQQPWLVPIIDASYDTGSNTRYHVLLLAYFLIHSSNVNCNPQSATGPGPGPTATPKPKKYKTWFIQGDYLGMYTPTGVGRHGDLTHWSGHTVFLDP